MDAIGEHIKISGPDANLDDIIAADVKVSQKKKLQNMKHKNLLNYLNILLKHIQTKEKLFLIMLWEADQQE